MDKIIEHTEIIIPVKNIKLKAVEEGWSTGSLDIMDESNDVDDTNEVWNDCMKKPANIGPIDIPIIMITTLIPKEMPLNWIGLEVNIMLNTPVFSKAKPIAIIAKLKPTTSSSEWKINMAENPIKEIIVPNKTGLVFPIFEIIKPDAGAKMRKIIMNGSWIIAASIAFPPNPTGGGVLTKKGMVWYTRNIGSPNVSTSTLENNNILFRNSLRSIKGKGAFFSTMMNNIDEIVAIMSRMIEIRITE